jgi:curved DNA-binding protein CbpA
MLQEYYNLLDLSPGANADDIKRAYRLKAKLYHPDANPEPEAHIQFIRIKEAFDILLKIKHLENYRKYEYNRFSHPHDPYFQSSHQYHTQHSTAHARHGHGENIDLNDFLTGKVGRTIYLTVHIFFIFMGLLIFVGPIYTFMTRGFDPYISLFDSLFAAVAAMVFGVIMMVKISGSVFHFIKKGF